MAQMSKSSNGRVGDKVAVVVGAGQTEGDTIGNGRATAMLLAREGATVLAVDRDLAGAEGTVEMIESEGGAASAWRADITSDDDCKSIANTAIGRYGRIDILVNNVGIGTGDSGATSIAEDAWDLIHDVNLKGMWMTCRHVLPLLRAQGSGSVVNISSVAAICSTPFVAYKTSKAAVNALTEQLAMSSAKRGVRVNAIMPGLMDTPMAIEGLATALDIDKESLRETRSRSVPLNRQMGTAWDVAYAALFLASDEAGFITGEILRVDGGQGSRVG